MIADGDAPLAVAPRDGRMASRRFETSDRRKPGEIVRDAIERRLSLMQSMDEVTRKLLQKLWFARWVHSNAAGRCATFRHDLLDGARQLVCYA